MPDSQSEFFLLVIIKIHILQTIICVRSTNNPLPKGVIDFEETLKSNPIEEIAPGLLLTIIYTSMNIIYSVTPDTVSIIYYSSGTTGQPKGVVLTHRAVHCQVEMLRRFNFHASVHNWTKSVTGFMKSIQFLAWQRSIGIRFVLLFIDFKWWNAVGIANHHICLLSHPRVRSCQFIPRHWKSDDFNEGIWWRRLSRCYQQVQGISFFSAAK